MAGEVVQLRRFDTSQPWGFKMQGGVDTGCPIHVAQVGSNSISGKAGLQNGDLIIRIGGMDVTGSTHAEARNEMIRSGNEIDLTVQKGGVAVQQRAEPEPVAACDNGDDETYKDVQPKTYQILEKELPQAAATGGRPASIFDKKKKKRSEYTKTDKSGYLKAYGEQ